MRRLVMTDGSTPAASAETIAARLERQEEAGFWLDLLGPDQDDIRLLEETFRFHPLTIEDVRNRDQRPKVDEYPGYDFVVVFQADLDGDELALREHHLYVGPGWLVTVHEEPAPALEALAGRLAASADLVRDRQGFLTYLVIDAIVDATFPVLDRLDDMVDELEVGIASGDGVAALDRIYRLKHSVTEMRRFLGAQRDVFQRLVTHGIQVRHPEMSLYYRDVADHVIRQYETVDSLRDLLTSAMDVYLSSVSNRINQTIKALTVIASLFLPLSFLTGFFGMNFAFLVNELETPPLAFAGGVAFMVAATVFQLWLFRRRGWI